MFHVIKIGGKIIDDEFLLNFFLKIFHKLQGFKLLIHGGGGFANNFSKKLGFLSKMIEGRRITNTKILEILIMSYAGLLNKKLVASLQALGTNALGLSGIDGNFISSKKRKFFMKFPDYGHVGDFESIDIKNVYSLIQLNYIPVFCAITHNSSKGHLLNTNADTIASSIALFLSEIDEIYLHLIFEKKGLLKNLEEGNSYYTRIDFKILSRDKIISLGILPKIEDAFYACKNGVTKVSIEHPSFLRMMKYKTIFYYR